MFSSLGARKIKRIRSTCRMLFSRGPPVDMMVLLPRILHGWSFTAVKVDIVKVSLTLKSSECFHMRHALIISSLEDTKRFHGHLWPSRYDEQFEAQIRLVTSLNKQTFALEPKHRNIFAFEISLCLVINPSHPLLSVISCWNLYILRHKSEQLQMVSFNTNGIEREKCCWADQIAPFYSTVIFFVSLTVFEHTQTMETCSRGNCFSTFPFPLLLNTNTIARVLISGGFSSFLFLWCHKVLFVSFYKSVLLASLAQRQWLSDFFFFSFSFFFVLRARTQLFRSP